MLKQIVLLTKQKGLHLDHFKDINIQEYQKPKIVPVRKHNNICNDLCCLTPYFGMITSFLFRTLLILICILSHM